MKYYSRSKEKYFSNNSNEYKQSEEDENIKVIKVKDKKEYKDDNRK